MTRWFLLTPALVAAAFLMFVSKSVRADDAAPATQPSNGSITVTVNDSDGKPVAGAHVTITPPRKRAAAAQAKAPKGGKAIAKGDTGTDGTITLADIPAGDYSANARTDDGARGTAKVTVAAGATATVTVVVKAKPAAAPPADAPAPPAAGGGDAAPK